MSCRPWLKKVRRIIGRRLRSGSLTTQDALQLRDEALSSIRMQLPPPAASAPWRIDTSSCLELGRFIGACYRSGDLTPEDALDLFEELLPRARPGSVYALNQLLTVVARAPSSSSVSDGPSLAVSLYNRMARAGAKKVAPDQHTYGVIMGCCCQMGCLDLGFATFGQVLKTGWRMHATTFTHLLKALCDVKRTSDAMDIVLRRMPELGCIPDVISFNTLLKGLCDENKVQEAVELLRVMADDGRNCTSDVVSYATVIDGFFKQGEVDKAYILFREMLDHGISPDIVTWSSIIDGLCKTQAMDKAVATLQQMREKGIAPDCTTYTSLIHGYCSLGKWKEVVTDLMVQNGVPPNHHIFNIFIDAYGKHGMVDEAMLIFHKMRQQGLMPDVVNYRTVIDALCRAGRLDDAMLQLNQMIAEGARPNIYVYSTLIHGFSSCGNWEKAEALFHEMLDKGIHPTAPVFRAMMHNLRKEGRIMEAQNLSELMMACAGAKPDVIS